VREGATRMVVCRGGQWDDGRRNRIDSFVTDLHESSFCRRGVKN
jgi:hypothetical protein